MTREASPYVSTFIVHSLLQVHSTTLRALSDFDGDFLRTCTGTGTIHYAPYVWISLKMTVE